MHASPSPTGCAGASICATSATSGTVASPSNGRPFGGNAVCSAWAAGPGLTWLEHRGVGYMPLEGRPPYDAAYFEKYRGYAATELGRALTQARVDLVWRHWQGPVVDVGIGCGQFVEAHPAAVGFDVNPAGVAWLAKRGLYHDPRRHRYEAATFWDSLEHIANPAEILDNVDEFVFVALPIFADLAHVLRSKHFRPDEHAWYFTATGFVAFMHEHGFECLERNEVETTLGREDVHSFAFRRRGVK